MKKNLIATLADKNYVNQAKQLFSGLFFYAGWQGDYMLLAQEIPDKELGWFINKGILVKKCKPIAEEVVGKWPAVVMSKFYLFSPEFKKWKNIIYLDADIIVKASVDDLAKVEGFAAVGGHPNLSKLFMSKMEIKIRKKNVEILKKLKSKYDLREYSFNSGVFAFHSSIIKEKTFSEIMRLFTKYKQIIYGDEAIFNLFMYQKWKRLPKCFNVNPFDLKLKNEPEKAIGAIFHFYNNKPWNKNNDFYEEWTNNLEKADLIDLKKIPAAREYWTDNDIESYINYLKTRRKSYFYRNFIWKAQQAINKDIGLGGIVLKNISH